MSLRLIRPMAIVTTLTCRTALYQGTHTSFQLISLPYMLSGGLSIIIKTILLSLREHSRLNPCRAIPASLLHYRSCVLTLIHMYEPPHERPHVHSHRTPRIPQATGRPTLSPPLSLFLPSPPAPSVLARYFNGVPSKNLLPYTTRVASGVRCVHSAWPPLSVGHGPEHLNSPANTYYQSPPSDNNDILFGDDTLGQGTFGT